MKPTSNPFFPGATLAAFAISCSATFAVDRTWIGGDGDFSNSANWLDGQIPGLGDNAIVNNNGIIRVTDERTTNDILAGTSPGSTGTWEISAGKLAMGGGWFRLGTAPSGEGHVNLSGGELITTGQQNIGETTGGKGHVHVSGGIWTNNGSAIAVGGNGNTSDGGEGTLMLSGSGTIENNNELWIGNGWNGRGTMTVSAGTLNQDGWIAVGRIHGIGTLNMSGGTINKTNARSWECTLIGASAEGSGTFNQTGGAFNVQSGETWIAETGHGEWKASGGTANLGILNVGHDHGGQGTLTLQGADDGLTGDLANGGGNAVITATTVTVGNFAGTAGTVNLDGGTLVTNALVKGGGTGTLRFNGGTLKAATNHAGFVSGVTSTIRERGAVIDSNGFAVTVDTALEHGGALEVDGGLTKLGEGTLTLNRENSYTGATVIQGGTLALAAGGSIDASSGVVLHGGSLDASAKAGLVLKELSGTGTVIGALTVSTSLAIGNSPGTADFVGSLTLAATSTHFYEIDSSLDLADLANVDGDLNLASSHFDLIQLGSYQPSDKFTLFSYSGLLTGEFDDLADDSVFNGGGGMWRINYDDSSAGLNGGAHSKFVTITAVPEPAAATLIGLAGAALLARRRRQA